MSNKKFVFNYAAPQDITDPIAQLIIQQDLYALEAFYNQGWDIDAPFYLNDSLKEGVYPINLAISGTVYEQSLRWLLDKGVKVHGIEGRPPIVLAGFACSLEIVCLLLEHGADIRATDSVGLNILTTAISGEQKDLIYHLKGLGFPVEHDKTALRAAVMQGNKAIIQTLLELGVNPNSCKADMVFPYNPTPVCQAASEQQWDIVKLLVENGADVKISDQFGVRPYHYAEDYQNQAMMVYLRALEPMEWHDNELRKKYFISLNLSQGLIDILAAGQAQRHFIYDGDQDFVLKEIMFSSLTHTRLVCWQGHQFIDLLSMVNDYDAVGMLVWSIEDQQLANADYEHGHFTLLSPWVGVDSLFDIINQGFNEVKNNKEFI